LYQNRELSASHSIAAENPFRLSISTIANTVNNVLKVNDEIKVNLANKFKITSLSPPYYLQFLLKITQIVKIKISVKKVCSIYNNK